MQPLLLYLISLFCHVICTSLLSHSLAQASSYTLINLFCLFSVYSQHLICFLRSAHAAYSRFFMDLVLMNTFREAPSRAALQNVAPTPASLIARVEPFCSKHFDQVNGFTASLHDFHGYRAGIFENDLHNTSFLSLLFLGVSWHTICFGKGLEDLCISLNEMKKLFLKSICLCLSAHTFPLLHPHISFCRR